MNPWLNLLQYPFGQFDQNVNPVTTWFSPKYTFNFKGVPQIEEQVQAEVASFGTQLGALLDAVVELAGDKRSAELDRVRELSEKIEDVKAQHQKVRLDELKRDIERLKAQDAAAYAELVSELK